MQNVSKMKRSLWLVVMTSAMFIVAGVVVVLTAPVRAQGGAANFQNFHELLFKGFQADSSSPFIVKGDLIGTGVWQRVVGPVLGAPYTAIPAAPGFGGATCQAEYDRAVIVAEDGSTLTADVYGTRCQPVGSSIAHTMIGVYTPVEGTGRFQGATGSGPVTITAYNDGSSVLALEGFARLLH